jgi:hypothetical protein
MPSTHRPVSALAEAKVVVDRTQLSSNKINPKPWSGTVGNFGTIDGTAFENGNGEIELLFVGMPPDQQLGAICAKPAEGVIRPMIAQPSRAAADAAPWIPDQPTLAAKQWTLQALKDARFDGTAIVSTANGTTTLIAFYRGTGQPADVCAT